MSNLSDEALIQKIANQDTEAFQELIERFQSLVFNTAYRFVGNVHDAEDLAQEAFLRVFKNAGRYVPSAKFKTWFLRVVTNLCLDFIKKKKPVLLEEESLLNIPFGSNPSQEFEVNERKRTLQQAIQSLKETQRMALVLHHYEGLKYEEIAQVMGCSTKAVESLLVRAKKALRERLEREYFKLK